MNTALWIITGLLAAVFAFAGANKLVLSKERLVSAPGGGWASHFSPAGLKRIGAVEILGAVGLILPAVLGIAEVLVPWAAVGLAMVMAGAATFRVRRRDGLVILADLLYLSLLLFVVWGRFGPEAF